MSSSAVMHSNRSSNDLPRIPHYVPNTSLINNKDNNQATQLPISSSNMTNSNYRSYYGSSIQSKT